MVSNPSCCRKRFYTVHLEMLSLHQIPKCLCMAYGVGRQFQCSGCYHFQQILVSFFNSCHAILVCTVECLCRCYAGGLTVTEILLYVGQNCSNI